MDGILRVGGRLERASIGYNTRHPMILPRKHLVTNLIIKHYHYMEGRVGSSQVLATIRQKFWILQGPAAIKQVVRERLNCQRWNVRPGKQIMAPLSEMRVTVRRPKPPFRQLGSIILVQSW